MTRGFEYFTPEDLIDLAALLLRNPLPVRDLGLLGAAAARLKTTVFGDDAYDDVSTKAAALLQSIVKNHPLVDGNKRLGWLATAVFLELNGVSVTAASNDDVYELVVRTAAGHHTVEEITLGLHEIVDGVRRVRAATGMTPTGYRLVLVITALSVAHHLDHIWRDVTGWPMNDEFNPFSVSLGVYPVIVAGLILSRRQRVGARFWAFLAGVAAVFLLAVHVGPAAGDSVTTIPDQYNSTIADIAALAVLTLLIATLAAHCLYEIRRMSRTT